MNNLKIPNDSDHKFSLLKKKNFKIKNEKNPIIEIIDEEKLKKIEAYLEWEQEYYLINQSYLLERA